MLSLRSVFADAVTAQETFALIACEYLFVQTRQATGYAAYTRLCGALPRPPEDMTFTLSKMMRLECKKARGMQPDEAHQAMIEAVEMLRHAAMAETFAGEAATLTL